ncbi:MAG: hypothetical protein WCX65_05905 [bacterium]
MKKILFLTLALFSVTCLGAEAAVNAGVTMSKAGNSFYVSIGDYFSAPQKDVMYVSGQGIADEEIPVVFYLARQAKVAPAAIIGLRRKGSSWQAITSRYGFGPEIFYVPVSANAVVGPPYGHAYGYYRNNPRKDWKKIKLGDDDIINLVNLKFISEHYKYPAATIMEMRQKHKGFYAINDDIENQKIANKKNAKANAAPANNKAVGKQLENNGNPEHLTGTKKQVNKVKKFYKKHNAKAKKYINDKG